MNFKTNIFESKYLLSAEKSGCPGESPVLLNILSKIFYAPIYVRQKLIFVFLIIYNASGARHNSTAVICPGLV